MPNLDGLIPDLDRACADILDEEIQYAADGTAFVAVQADVDYRDMQKSFDGAETVTQDIGVSFLKADVPAKPTSAARLTLAKRAGKTFKPLNVRTDESGTSWEFDVKEAVDG